jgi:hypothetical protein
MTSFLRHSRALAALIGYLLGSGLLELAHHDAASLMLESQPVVATHGCGAHEKHIPADQARHCLACSPFVQRPAVGTGRIIGTDPADVCFTLQFTHCPSTSEPDVISSGKRGPPCV